MKGKVSFLRRLSVELFFLCNALLSLVCRRNWFVARVFLVAFGLRFFLFLFRSFGAPEKDVGTGARHACRQGALPMHLLVCIRSNVRRFVLDNHIQQIRSSCMYNLPNWT